MDKNGWNLLEDTGRYVQPGDQLTDFRGESHYRFEYISRLPALGGGSEGKLIVTDTTTNEAIYNVWGWVKHETRIERYPSVFGCVITFGC